MKYIIAFFMIVTAAYGLDPNAPVAWKNEAGELRLYKNRLPTYWHGVGNYRKAGEAKWVADGWVNARKVSTTVTVDRTQMKPAMVPELDGNGDPVVVGGVTNMIEGTVHVYPRYKVEKDLKDRAAAALEVIAPERTGEETLEMIKQLSPAQFIDLAQARYDVASAAQRDDILANTIKMLAILMEANSHKINWRSEALASETKKVTTTELVED